MQPEVLKTKWYKPTKIKLLILAVIALVCTNIYSYSEYNHYYYDKVYRDAVPDVELTAVMGFYGVDMFNGKVLSSSNPGDIAIGKVVGFVTFPNISDQPKGARQYYEIAPVDAYDENGNQLFTLQETIKMSSIPPREFDLELLTVSSNTNQSVTLETESGQSFKINKRTDQVTVIDADGDISTLITNQNDYQDFIFELFGYR
ncbi:hypothetical protein N8083_00515 [Candidatus Pacebacteria bacterium]|nr:hypothetical protein [Candidatus Paceibacterota bacterium]